MTDALELAEAAVDRLMEAHDLPLDRDDVDVGVARWKGRNGVCKYNKRLDKKRFGERMGSLSRESGTHAIIINERILEDGNRAEFIDVIQHELAHAACYAEEFEYPSKGNGPMSSHGRFWKRMARRLGADDSACHNKRDRSDEFEYYISCPNPDCDTQAGRTKRSKIIKRPFDRMCSECGEHGLVSHDADKPAPTENGVVAVESIDWSNRTEWVDAGKP